MLLQRHLDEQVERGGGWCLPSAPTELKIQCLALKTGKFQVLLYWLQFSFWRNLYLTALISVVQIKSLFTDTNDLFKKMCGWALGIGKCIIVLLLSPCGVSEWWHFGRFSFKVRLSISSEKESLGKSFKMSNVDSVWSICSDWNSFLQETVWMTSWTLFQTMWLYNHVGCLNFFVFWDRRESLGITPRDEINGSNGMSGIWFPQTLALRSQDLKFQETSSGSSPALLILQAGKLKFPSQEPVLMVISALFRLVSNTALKCNVASDNVFFGVQD